MRKKPIDGINIHFLLFLVITIKKPIFLFVNGTIGHIFM